MSGSWWILELAEESKGGQRIQRACTPWRKPGESLIQPQEDSRVHMESGDRSNIRAPRPILSTEDTSPTNTLASTQARGYSNSILSIARAMGLRLAYSQLLIRTTAVPRSGNRRIRVRVASWPPLEDKGYKGALRKGGWSSQPESWLLQCRRG